ncbi:MAG: hypothetical protein HXY41_10565 [Chloroflexi bacterium]|nr:hypothetical protein [Chloroflexota bacterium]
MRLRLFICFALFTALFISGCQGPPPTVYVLVVTATSEGEPATSVMTPEATALTETPTISPTLQPTSTTDPRPTPTTGQIQIAEQVFEHGRMLWIQPRQQIWVMQDLEQGEGRWLVFDDTFKEGEMESDPAIVPPTGFYQPERGFGKLWRANQDIRDALGWGVTPEFGYVSDYEYHPGGTIDALAPGYHILYSLYKEKFRFNETNGTWETVS